MYKPELRYSFCAMRYTSLYSQLSLIKYLNALGINPYLSWQKDRPHSSDIIRASKISYLQRKFGDNKMDFDIVFAESSGYSRFEKNYLIESKNNGKINIKINNSISTYNQMSNPHYTPDRTRDTLDGMYVKGQRTIDHFKTFTEDLFFINGCDPDWDWFNTNDFKIQVRKVKQKYGNKLLILGSSLLSEKEFSWYENITKQAVKRGFQVVVHLHPGRPIPKFFKESPIRNRVDSTTPRYVLFAAASHIIVNLSSSMSAECLYLGKKVACNSLVTHFTGYMGKHYWLKNKHEWTRNMLPKIGNAMYEAVPRVYDMRELDSFLASNEPIINQDEVDTLFGWRRCPSYCSHLFEEVETKANELLSLRK